MAPALTPGLRRRRDLALFRSPQRWQTWPFLPVIRLLPGGRQVGVLYDARNASGTYGYSATVFLCLCGTPHKVNYVDSAVMRSWWM